METLAERLPLDLLRRTSARDGLIGVEALLFGVAGLVPASFDGFDTATFGYVARLDERFAHYRQRTPVRPLPVTAWQFFRLRPAGFPTRRLAQAAALLAPGGLLAHDPLGTLLDALAQPKPLTALRRLFTTPEPSAYWQTHVRFGKSSKAQRASMGRSRADVLMVNAVLPVLLLHARQTDAPALAEQVETLYRKLPGASDEITRRYTAERKKPRHALAAQGMQQLARHFCAEGRCLSCAVGNHLLKVEATSSNVE